MHASDDISHGDLGDLGDRDLDDRQEASDPQEAEASAPDLPPTGSGEVSPLTRRPSIEPVTEGSSVTKFALPIIEVTKSPGEGSSGVDAYAREIVPSEPTR